MGVRVKLWTSLEFENVHETRGAQGAPRPRPGHSTAPERGAQQPDGQACTRATRLCPLDWHPGSCRDSWPGQPRTRTTRTGTRALARPVPAGQRRRLCVQASTSRPGPQPGRGGHHYTLCLPAERPSQSVGTSDTAPPPLWSQSPVPGPGRPRPRGLQGEGRRGVPAVTSMPLAGSHHVRSTEAPPPNPELTLLKWPRPRTRWHTPAPRCL